MIDRSTESNSGAQTTDVSRPDRVREAVTEAAGRLFAERGIHAVSVREIAREVGVSHTLLHLYFGSKEEILRSVLNSYGGGLAEQILGDVDAPAAAGEAFRQVAAQPEFVRVLAAALVEGTIPNRIPRDPSAVKALSQRLAHSADGEFDPRVVSAALGCMVMGWAVAGDWLFETVGVDSGKEEVVAQMAALAERVARDYT